MMQNSKDKWAPLVKAARTAQSLSQGEFGAQFGVDQAQVSRWERKKVAPNFEVRRRIKEIIGHAHVDSGWSLDQVMGWVRQCPVPALLMNSRFEFLATSIGAFAEMPKLAKLKPGESDAYTLAYFPANILDEIREEMEMSGFYDHKVIAGTFCLMTDGERRRWMHGQMVALDVGQEVFPLCYFRFIPQGMAVMIGEHVWQPLLRGAAPVSPSAGAGSSGASPVQPTQP